MVLHNKPMNDTTASKRQVLPGLLDLYNFLNLLFVRKTVGMHCLISTMQGVLQLYIHHPTGVDQIGIRLGRLRTKIKDRGYSTSVFQNLCPRCKRVAVVCDHCREFGKIKDIITVSLIFQGFARLGTRRRDRITILLKLIFQRLVRSGTRNHDRSIILNLIPQRFVSLDTQNHGRTILFSLPRRSSSD